MFAMGLTLTIPQIKEQIKRTSLMLKALLANIIIVPLAAYSKGDLAFTAVVETLDRVVDDVGVIFYRGIFVLKEGG